MESIEDTIFNYYEFTLSGDMDRANEYLDWDSEEGSIIDYFSGRNKLYTLYKIVSCEDIEIADIFDKSENRREAEIILTFLDKAGIERKEKHQLKLKINENSEWKITSIVVSIN